MKTKGMNSNVLGRGFSPGEVSLLDLASVSARLIWAGGAGAEGGGRDRAQAVALSLGSQRSVVGGGRAGGVQTLQRGSEDSGSI